MSVCGLIGRCSAVFKICAALGAVVFFAFGSLTHAVATEVKDSDAVAERVICNVIKFVQKLGLPIMTGVILGSSIMAIFGKVSWPAIVMLVVFTGVFFGAGKIMQKFAEGLADVKGANEKALSSWTCG